MSSPVISSETARSRSASRSSRCSRVRSARAAKRSAGSAPSAFWPVVRFLLGRPGRSAMPRTLISFYLYVNPGGRPAAVRGGRVSRSLRGPTPLPIPLHGAAFPGRSSLAPQSRRHRAPPARSPGLKQSVRFDTLDAQDSTHRTRRTGAAMTARILEGKATAAAIREDLTRRVAELARRGITPGLGTVLAGADPGSRSYVNGKHRDSVQVGIASIRRELPATATQAEVEEVVDELNADPACTGYIVQLPLPAGLDAQRVLQRMDPAKGADGLHPLNLGKLVLGE